MADGDLASGEFPKRTARLFLFAAVVLNLFAADHLLAQNTQPRTDLHGDPLPEGAAGRLGTVRLTPTVGHQQPISALAFSPGGSHILTASRRDGTIRLWQTSTTREQRLWNGLAAPGDVAFSPDGAKAALADGALGVRIVDVASGQEERVLKTAQPLEVLRWAPDAKSLVTATRAGQVEIWTGASKTGFALYEGKEKEGTFATLSADGRLLAASQHETLSGLGGAILTVCQTATGRPLATLDLSEPANTTQVVEASARTLCWAAAFSPDGKYLATSQSQQVTAVRTQLSKHRVRLWEVATGQQVFDLADLRAGASRLAFAPDGRHLAYAAPQGYSRTGHVYGDHFVVVLDLITRREVARFYPEAGTVLCLVFAPDGKTLISAGNDNTALLWKMAALAPKADVKNLSAEEIARLWTELGDVEAGKAYRALTQLGQGGEAVATLLKDKLAAAAARDGKHIEQLIEDLDSEQFTRRNRATAELAKLGNEAEARLAQTLKETKSPEFRRRLELLLKKIERAVPSRDVVQAQRALTVLERLATPGARAVLETIAGGAPEARLTQQARQALERLK